MMIITLGLLPLPLAVSRPVPKGGGGREGIEAERKSQRLLPLHHRLKRRGEEVSEAEEAERKGGGRRERGIPPERERERY